MDIVQNLILDGQCIWFGGFVEDGFIVCFDNVWVQFWVMDMENVVFVIYIGILLDLFCEGQGVVIEGIIGFDGVFVVDSVFVKYDENYMFKEVVEVLKDQGYW